MTLTSISYICFHAQNIATKPTGGGFQCFTVYSESTNYFERMRSRARAIQRLQLHDKKILSQMVSFSLILGCVHSKPQDIE